MSHSRSNNNDDPMNDSFNLTYLREPSPPRGSNSGAAENSEALPFSSGNTNLDIFMREHNSGPSSGESWLSDNEEDANAISNLPPGSHSMPPVQRHIPSRAPNGFPNNIQGVVHAEPLTNSRLAETYYQTKQYRNRQPLPSSQPYSGDITYARPIPPHNTHQLHNAIAEPPMNGMDINQTLNRHARRITHSVRKLGKKKRRQRQAANTLKRSIRRYMKRKRNAKSKKGKKRQRANKNKNNSSNEENYNTKTAKKSRRYKK